MHYFNILCLLLVAVHCRAGVDGFIVPNGAGQSLQERHFHGVPLLAQWNCNADAIFFLSICWVLAHSRLLIYVREKCGDS